MLSEGGRPCTVCGLLSLDIFIRFRFTVVGHFAHRDPELFSHASGSISPLHSLLAEHRYLKEFLSNRLLYPFLSTLFPSDHHHRVFLDDFHCPGY